MPSYLWFRSLWCFTVGYVLNINNVTGKTSHRLSLFYIDSITTCSSYAAKGEGEEFNIASSRNIGAGNNSFINILVDILIFNELILAV